MQRTVVYARRQVIGVEYYLVVSGVHGAVGDGGDQPSHGVIDVNSDGAFLAQIKIYRRGIGEWIGVIDINSLYPSALRAMNMGIETIVGQLRPVITDNYIQDKFKKVSNMTYAHAWEEQFSSLEYQAVMDQKSGIDITIDWEDSGKSDTITAKQCYDLIFNSDQKWMLSANGTIFTYERDAIVPGLFAHWYKIRKEYQKIKAESIVPSEKIYYDRLTLL